MISFLDLFAALNDNDVRYLVAGGWAVNLYGVERATGDLDLVVYLEQRNLEKFIDVVTRFGFRPRVPVAAIEFADAEKRRAWRVEKGMMVFSFHDPHNPFVLLDAFIEIPFDFETVYAERSRIQTGRVEIPVVPLETLIMMKQQAGRPQDLADIHYLRKIQEGTQ
ncbi:nucleotidyl transferase AbiEii/AbiGii toxin family protein [Trichlorobacter ammonificans]|uniref:Uncharacterized protein n=1 Tax=Trichlorobacter ammonificans TaxID=2916410 RepID=A0ABN8HHZ4_9BACT|nr:nucleotidyl transferase AbiEii/AbiGii toxin family protein [Trichlorobacter ammonificans]CAH2032430.1 conserved protein of unknown function [Trichlorobacter ammonificans]